MTRSARAPRSRSVRLAAAAAAVTLLGGLSACTSVGVTEPYTPGIGTNAEAGPVALRALVLVADGSSAAKLTGSLVASSNSRLTEVKAVAVKSDLSDAGSLQVAPVTLELPADQLVKFDGTKVSGEGLTPGLYARMTFSFSDGGDTTVLVPIVSAEQPDYKNA